MCRSQAQGGRRCRGRSRVTAGQGGDKATRRVDGNPEADADRRFFDLRESGYTGPIDQDGNALTEAEARMSPHQRREAAALESMKAGMREWRSRDVPEPRPAAPMDPQLAKALGCDTPEGMASYERGRALREAGYDGPLDRYNNIPDPGSPAEQQTLSALAALSLTHS